MGRSGPSRRSPSSSTASGASASCGRFPASCGRAGTSSHPSTIGRRKWTRPAWTSSAWIGGSSRKRKCSPSSRKRVRTGFRSCGEIDLEAGEKVIHWGGKDYTFAWLALRRSRMRVLLVCGTYPPMRCGVGDYTAGLAHAFGRRGDVTVAVLTGSGAAGAREETRRTLPGSANVEDRRCPDRS